jgi:hypothetical protein
MTFTWRGDNCDDSFCQLPTIVIRPKTEKLSAEILATVQQSPQTELTFAREVPYHPRDSVHVLTAHMKNESDYQITGQTFAAKLFSADRTAGVSLPRNIDLQHRLVFWHDT